MKRILPALILAIGCTHHASIPAVRYANRPAVAVVNDRRDVAKTPHKGEFNIWLYHFDGSFFRLITRGLELPRPRRALGVNALDEVPDSTWFTNRIGTRDLTPEEVATGPDEMGSPEQYKPWTILSSKVGGKSIGFIIKDSRGKKYILKFDSGDGGHAGPQPELETASEVITSKLLWACGYNVAENHIVYFKPDELEIAPDAEIKDWHGSRGKLDQAVLQAKLAHVVHEKDGTIRGMASYMIDGKAVGGHKGEGVRRDDRNDRIPHELRRDLRGLYGFYSWLDQTDLKEDNSLDTWIEDPANPDVHYVKHYLLDFGSSLGAAAVFQQNPRMGIQYAVDFPGMARELFTLGMGSRPWSHRKKVPLRGVGMFDAKFDPGHWKAETPAYIPVRMADNYDKFWAAKIIMSFTPAQIRAAVETAKLSDPRATEYLTKTLIARQRKVARYWFSRVAPLDKFEVGEDQGVCFADLLLTYDLAKVGATTQYAIRTYDKAGHSLAPELNLGPEADGRTCTGPIRFADGGDDYTIVRIDTTRPKSVGTTYVHVARDPATGELRVIGIWRQ